MSSRDETEESHSTTITGQCELVSLLGVRDNMDSDDTFDNDKNEVESRLKPLMTSMNMIVNRVDRNMDIDGIDPGTTARINDIHTSKDSVQITIQQQPLSNGSDCTQTSVFRSRKIQDKIKGQDAKKRKGKAIMHKTSSETSQKIKYNWKAISLLCPKFVGLPTTSVLDCIHLDEDQHEKVVRSTFAAMNLLAKVLLWSSICFLIACVVWYSFELKNNGTDPHLIAWFSAGAFVLLGFPISMYGIVMHLANYNQPNIQCYIVRILWMVPIYSMESWLCLRFRRYAIYIETMRDCYEAYVLYNFLQFLIQVLGGEEQLIQLLKDKSPTRGSHRWGLQWCIKPWLMGQPISRTVYPGPLAVIPNTNVVVPTGKAATDITSTMTSTSSVLVSVSAIDTGNHPTRIRQLPARPITHVQWTSPFFIKCKFGVLQYVLLKVVSSIFVMVLELNGLYKEGDFTPNGGFLYICILTNVSQCWALYCLIFFYYATKNELSPIRPVGKFLSVKALVFFTWWQSVAISMLYQADMIPHYNDRDAENEWTSEDVAKGLQDYLICIEMFVGAIVHTFVFPHTEYLEAAVAARSKSYQQQGATSTFSKIHKRIGRNRHHHGSSYHSRISGNASTSGGEIVYRNDSSYISKTCGMASSERNDLEMATHSDTKNSSNYATGFTATEQQQNLLHLLPTTARTETLMMSTPLVNTTKNELDNVNININTEAVDSGIEERGTVFDNENMDQDSGVDSAFSHKPAINSNHNDDEDSDNEGYGAAASKMYDPYIKKQQNPGFVHALWDSTIPRDVMNSTVGIVKGDYRVEKKTLLYHAATSDEYDLFSLFSKRRAFNKLAEATTVAIGAVEMTDPYISNNSVGCEVTGFGGSASLRSHGQP